MSGNSTTPTNDADDSLISECIFQQHQWLIFFTVVFGAAVAFMGKRFSDYILLITATGITFFGVMHFLTITGGIINIGHYIIAGYCGLSLAKLLNEYDQKNRNFAAVIFNGGCSGALGGQFLFDFVFPDAEGYFVWVFVILGTIAGGFFVFKLGDYIIAILTSFIGAYILVQPILALFGMYDSDCLRANRLGIVAVIIMGVFSFFLQQKIWGSIYTEDFDEDISLYARQRHDQYIAGLRKPQFGE